MFSVPVILPCCALAVFVIGYVILSRFLPVWAAVLIAAIKALIPLIYFGAVFDNGGWLLSDDVRYYDVGATLVDLGYRPWELVLEPEGRDQLVSIAASRHTLYYLWNMTAQWIIGTYYFAPVFCNIALTFFTGAIVFGTLRLAGMSRTFCQGMLVFHMLHWDYLSWTSLINVKETVVEALLVISLYCVIRFVHRKSWVALLGVAGSFLLLFLIRLYVPFLIIIAVGLWVLLQWDDPRKYPLIPVVAGLLFVLYLKIGSYDQQLHLHMLIVGAFRYVLTPQPWSVNPGCSFLKIPSLFQWAFLVPAVVGTVQIWRANQTCRLLVLVMLIFIAFYSVFPENQGPRHRVQMVAMFAMVEFQFISSWLLGRVSADEEVGDFAAESSMVAL